ncbi:MAG: pentapeptide repeat-containing protein, partial [Nitrospira sp.]|nr:pentapeptide repeat-containing protein [Nitrospira sp.]
MIEIPARSFLEDLTTRNGRMECVRVVGDLNLHDAVAGGAWSIEVVRVTDCVFDSVEVIDRRRLGAPSSSPRHEAVVPLIFERCVFKRPLLLQEIKFARQVEFVECRFEQYVNCARSHFSGVSFRDCAFDETVYFQGTCFAGRNSANGNTIDADFSEVTFQKGADFDGAVFFGSATFTKARFYEATTFTDIRFHSHRNVGSSSQSLAWFSPVFSFTAVQVFGSVGFLESGNDLKRENAISKGSGSHRPQVCSCEQFLGRETFVRLFEKRRIDQWGQSREEPLALDFTNVSVHSKYGLRFHSVNLEKCKLAGTNLDLCYFNNV